ncbi:hypothetical protein [Haloferula sargassicola]|uniref:Anti-sigma factor n=1 Tax=Haloferula sargassicola TaxID=490096 RepID=A0ABP9URL1_9BACT
MNTTPDDEILARWVEDELDETRAREVEAWAQGQPEWLARRVLARESKSLFARAGFSGNDVPSGEFFNARIQREIAQAGPAAVPARPKKSAWLVPLTAAAGIALGFWAGRGASPDAVPPPMAELAPVIYTPEKGVDAQLVSMQEATVIVLDGVNAIPDTWELPETASNDPGLLPIAHTR